MTTAGLCETCTHAQTVVSSKGSLFVLCRLSEVDPTFRRYPMLPVIACTGYTSANTPGARPSGRCGQRAS